MRVRRAIGVLVITVVAALSVNSQEATKTQSAEPADAAQQTTVPDYVFPTPRERFNLPLQPAPAAWTTVLSVS